MNRNGTSVPFSMRIHTACTFVLSRSTPNACLASSPESTVVEIRMPLLSWICSLSLNGMLSIGFGSNETHPPSSSRQTEQLTSLTIRRSQGVDDLILVDLTAERDGGNIVARLAAMSTRKSLATGGRREAQPVDLANKFGQRSRPHLFHHAAAVELHRLVADADLFADLPVDPASHDQRKNFPLASTECVES